ncbi:MAG: hypothetical protein J6I46_04670 [Ruminococcus sp.]|nr:hypothetical protein [Ruminococcus sp.]MBP3797053.1 hypothetical protein [Ruminococcus sp.]
MDLLIALVLYGILTIGTGIAGITSLAIGVVKILKGVDGTSKAPMILIICGLLMLIKFMWDLSNII